MSSINLEVIFPRGLAENKAFFNRKAERQRLAKNIKSGQHTLLISPRRYGKTSLVKFLLSELQLPFGEADLFVAVDAERIEESLLRGIRTVLDNITSPLEQKLARIRHYFQKINAKWTVGTKGIEIALIPENRSDPANNILEALKALEFLLAERKQKAVLFIDEVQEIGEVASNKAIEGAIRHVAQETKYLNFIFSGSKRHLLINMFYDKARPLYKLCDRINLERIPEDDYCIHLCALAQQQWGKPLSPEAFQQIIKLTERHPYYVNVLCHAIWEESKRLPIPDFIQERWFILLKEEKVDIIQELSNLSPGQRKVLIILANGMTKGFTSKLAIEQLKMSGSSITEALEILNEKDYIERLEEDGYRIIDPLMKSALQLYFGPE